MSQKKVGIFLSYLIELTKILTSLLYTPIMLRLLGRSEYGLYQLVNSVVSYLSLLSLGFGSAYMRYYARNKAQNDEVGIARLNGMFLTIFSIIAFVCLLCGSVMVVNVEAIFSTGLTADEIEKARVLMALMVFNLALTFPNIVFNNFVTANERFVFQKTLILLQTIFNPFLTLPLLLMGYGSVGMVLVTTGLTIIVFISNLVFCLKKLQVRFLFRGFKWIVFREMFIFTFFIFLNKIIDQVNWSVDKFLLGRLIGTSAVAVYGIGALLNSLYIQTSKSISNVFVPQINKIVAEGQGDEKLTQLITRVGRMQFLILGLVMTGIIFFGQSFIRLWAGKGYENAYFVTLLLIIPETVPLIQNLGVEVQRAKNKHKVRSVVYFFMSVANVFISIPLIKFAGEIGAAFGTTISLVIANIFFMNWYYQKKINLDMYFFWKNIFTLCKGLVIPVGVGVLILKFIDTSGLLKLFLYSSIYALIYMFSMWVLGMNYSEKSQVLNILKNVRNKMR